MSSDHKPGTRQPTYADRAYRSVGALIAGVVLLALGTWLGVDALARGDGRERALAVAALVTGVPLLVAFTLRPAVFAGEDRLRVRNPFRTITVPWAAVEEIRARYSSEVVTADGKYQLWAIPVSLRARKKAARREARAGGASLFGPGRGRGAISDPALRTPGAGSRPGEQAEDPRPPADKQIAELQELAGLYASRETAQGSVRARWAYEILGPAVAGALALVILLAVG